MSIKKLPFLLAVGCALFSGCQKEDSTRLTLTAEHFKSTQSKMTVAGTSSYWETGDNVRFSNGDIKEITVTNNTASVSDLSSTPEWAVFPSTIYSGYYDASHRLTVTLPRVYQFSEQAASPYRQILNAPMAAYGVSNGKMEFKHLTGALNVVLTNDLGSTLTLDRIIVKAIRRGQGDNYRLNGSFNYYINDLANQTASTAIASTDDEKEVVLAFDNVNYLLPGGPHTFQIPIPSVGTDENPPCFSITVEGHINGTKYRYGDVQQYNSCAILGRAEIGYAPMTISTTLAQGTLQWIEMGPLFDEVQEETNAYYIRTPQDFKMMATAINSYPAWTYEGNSYQSAHYVITNNINMDGFTIEPLWSFSGSITSTDPGINRNISNLTVLSRTDGTKEYFGLLFKPVGEPTDAEHENDVTLSDLSFQNLTLKRNSTAQYSSYVIGALCSYYQYGYENAGSYHLNIERCTIPASNTYGLTLDFAGVAPTTVVFGGLVGLTQNNVTLKDCLVKLGQRANITMSSTNATTSFFGGLVGRQYGVGLTLKLVSVTLNLDASWGVGAWTLNTYAKSGNYTNFGGVMGELYENSNLVSDLDNQSLLQGNVTINSSGTLNAKKVAGNRNETSWSGINNSSFTINNQQ